MYYPLLSFSLSGLPRLLDNISDIFHGVVNRGDVPEACVSTRSLARNVRTLRYAILDVMLDAFGTSVASYSGGKCHENSRSIDGYGRQVRSFS